MSDGIAAFLGFAAIGAWLTAVVNDFSQPLWLLVDFLIFPIAIIRGLGMWFGVGA